MRRATWKHRKLLRTLQSEIPFLMELKNISFLHLRRLLRSPHENEFLFIRSIPDLDDRCYVDVGANQGQSIEAILLFKPNAQIIAFEPNIVLSEKLRRRYRNRENIHIVGKGLADKSDKFTLYQPSYKRCTYDGLASFRREEAASWLNRETLYLFNPSKLRVSETECYAETLDAQRLKPIFIKIDVQGYEYEVIVGARGTISQYRPIILIEGFSSNSKSVSLANELGYEEFYFDGRTCVKGSKGRNSFLLPSEGVDLIGRT